MRETSVITLLVSSGTVSQLIKSPASDPGPWPTILPALVTDLRRFEAALKKFANNGVGKERHSTIGMMNGEPFFVPRSCRKLQASVSHRRWCDRLRCESHGRHLRSGSRISRIKPGVHARENREVAGGRESKSCLLAEGFGVVAICSENSIEDFAHGME